MAREKEVKQCGLCGKRINGKNGGVYCVSCSRRLEAGESGGAIMAGVKDVEPVGAKKYVCITKDGKRHDIEAENARAANSIAEKRFGYANISVPPQESLRAKDGGAREAERWARHMHEDGLWCGDVNCKTCAKSGAMAKGVKEMKRAKDAEEKCAGCGTSSRTLYEDDKTGTHGGQFWCARCGGRRVKGGRVVKPADDVKPVGDELSFEEWHKQLKQAARKADQPMTYFLPSQAHYTYGQGKSVEEALRILRDINHGRGYGRRQGGMFDSSDDPILGNAGQTKDASSPFDVDTDAGAERIVRQETRAGLIAAQIARKHGFSLSFVKEVLNVVRPVGDGAESARQELERRLKEGRHEMNLAKRDGSGTEYQRHTSDIVKRLERELASAKDVKPVGDSRSSDVHGSDFAVGDKVHLGLGAKGGAGFEGVITKLDGDAVWVRASGDFSSKYGPKVYKGQVKNLSRT